MYHYTSCIILVLLLASFTESQRIYTNTNGIAKGVGLGAANCMSSGLVFLTDSSTACLSSYKGPDTPLSSSCPSGMPGATSIFCTANQVCFALNPSSVPVTLVVVNSNFSAVTTSFTTTLINPVGLTVLQTGANYQIFVADFDGTNSDIWAFNYTTAANTVTSNVITTVNGLLSSIGLISNTTLVTSVAHSTSVQAYSLAGDSIGSFGGLTFTSVESVSVDFYNRVFVYDTDCSCFQVFNGTGYPLYTIPHSSIPMSVSHSRDAHFVVDSAGIVALVEVLSLTNAIYTNSTCLSRGSTATIAVTGGAPPYTYYTYPWLQKATPTSATNTTFTGIPVLNYNPNTFTIYDDAVNRLYSEGVSGGGTRIIQAPASQYPVHTGNFSYAVWFTSGTHFNFKTADIIDPTLYAGLEMYINPGAGGQTFSIDLSNGVTTLFNVGDLPNNTWTRVYLSFKMGAVNKYTQISLNDKSGATNASLVNPVFFDDLTLIPYSSPFRRFSVSDFCSNTVWAPNFTVSNDNVMQVNLKLKPVTCNAAGIQAPSLSNDGSIVANPVRGTGPYTYQWSFSNSTNSSLSGLPSLSSNILIYDNFLNASFIDGTTPSTKKNDKDTTYFHSAPYSYSFAPTQNQDNVYFNMPGSFNASRFTALEFWVNGGPIGGQVITVALARGAVTAGQAILSITRLNGITTIPANTWMKVTYPITITTTFSGIFFYGAADWAQPRIYFDDIMLISADLTVSVTDATNCTVTNPYIQIAAPEPMNIIPSIQNVECFGTADGQAYLNVTGGTAPYSYSWNASDTLSNIPESRLSISVQDVNGCSLPPISLSVFQPTRLAANVTVKPIQCPGEQTTIATSATGGVGPYTYVWTSNATNPIRVPHPSPLPLFLDAFVNGYSIRSGNGYPSCAGTGSLNNTAYPLTHSGYCSLVLALSAESPAISFGGGSSTSMSPTKYSGVSFWIFLSSTENANTLSLELKKEEVANSPLVPLTSLLSAPLVAPGWNNVFFNFSVSTNSFPDRFEIVSSDPESLEDIFIDDVSLIPNIATNVGYSAFPGFTSEIVGVAATYSLTIIDGNGCTLMQDITVSEPKRLSLQPEITAPSSSSDTDGAVDLIISGGTAPYTYLWVASNDSSKTVSNLGVGEYKVVITDANGCELSTTVFVAAQVKLRLAPYDRALSGGIGALVAIGVLIGFFAIIMLIKYNQFYSVHGLFYSSLVVLGVMISYIAALVLLPEQTDRLCVAFPWLLGIAFSLVYGCLFIKAWVLYMVWLEASQFKKTTLTPYSIAKMLGIFISFEIILLIIWTAVDPPHTVRVKMVDNTLAIQCDTKTPIFWIIFLVIKGIWLVVGAVFSVLTREIAKDYGDMSGIAYAIYNNVVLAVIAAPLAILLKTVPGGRLVIMVAVIVLAFTFTLFIMYFKVWQNAFQQQGYPAGTDSSTTRSNGSGSATRQSTAISGPANYRSRSSNSSRSRSAHSSNSQSPKHSVAMSDIDVSETAAV